MSSLCVLMSRHGGGVICDRTQFEQDDADPFAGDAANGASAVIDPALISATPVNAMLDRVRTVKRLRVVSPESIRDFEAFEQVHLLYFLCAR